MKRITIVLASILVVAGVAMIIVAAASCGFDFSKFGAKYETNYFTSSESFENIKIDVKEADVDIKRSLDGEFKVELYESEKLKYETAIYGDTLTITVNDSRTFTDRLTVFSKAPKITIYLSETEYKKAEINAKTGDVNIYEGLKFESVDIVLSTGDASVGGKVSGYLSVKVSTGEITVNPTNCVSATFTASTGDITLDGVIAEEKLEVFTTTGDVKVKNCDGKDIKITSSTGDVKGTLLTPKTFDCKTSTGKVSVPQGTSGGLCEIRTSTGDINIRIVSLS